MNEPAVSTEPRRDRLRRPLPTLLFLCLTLGLVGSALAGDVSGRITVAPGYRPTAPADDDAPRDHTWEEWNGVLPVLAVRFRPERELLAVLTGPGSAAPTGCSFRLKNGGLSPSTLAAKAGQDLDIQNLDGCSHELFVEGISEFSPLTTAPQGGRSVRMPSQAGTHLIQDALYPHVQGHLHIVSDLVACGQVQPGGAYRFTDVAPGDYTLRIFHGSEELAQQPVTVEAGSRASATTVPAITFPRSTN